MRQVRPALGTPTDDYIGAAARIAALVDGLPLAIELATAQARHLSLSQLAASLAGSLDLLDRGIAYSARMRGRVRDRAQLRIGRNAV